MTREKFDDLINNSAIVKIATVGGGIFKDPEGIVAIQFFFMHGGDFSELPPKKRLYLSTFLLKNLIPEIQPYPIENNTLTICIPPCKYTLLKKSTANNFAFTYNCVVTVL